METEIIMSSNTLKFKEISLSFGTRNLGAQIRERIIEMINVNEKVFLDFEEVNVVTNSFADECFTELRKSLPNDIFKSKIAFINTNDFIQRVIISAL